MNVQPRVPRALFSPTPISGSKSPGDDRCKEGSSIIPNPARFRIPTDPFFSSLDGCTGVLYLLSSPRPFILFPSALLLTFRPRHVEPPTSPLYSSTFRDLLISPKFPSSCFSGRAESARPHPCHCFFSMFFHNMTLAMNFFFTGGRSPLHPLGFPPSV